MALLGGVDYTRLGDRRFLASVSLLVQEFMHPMLALSIFPRFQEALEAVNQEIDRDNKTRLHAYTLMQPRNIPQSINA